MANIQQNILVRTDLGFTQGLMAAQVAHIHAALMIESCNDDYQLVLDMNGEQRQQFREWVKAPYLLVRGVSNLETLEHFKRLANDAELPVNEWRDTVFCKVADDLTLPFPDVMIGISIGPADSDKIKAVVGKLPLL